MNAQIASLQEQVNELYASMNALRGGDHLGMEQAHHIARSISISQISPNASGSPNTYRSPKKPPQFRGPTSSAFSLNVAKNTLHTMGYPGLAEGLDDGLTTQDDTPAGSPPSQSALLPANSARDPLLSLTKDEAVRLCRVYEEEMVGQELKALIEAY